MLRVYKKKNIALRNIYKRSYIFYILLDSNWCSKKGKQKLKHFFLFKSWTCRTTVYLFFIFQYIKTISSIINCIFFNKQDHIHKAFQTMLSVSARLRKYNVEVSAFIFTHDTKMPAGQLREDNFTRSSSLQFFYITKPHIWCPQSNSLHINLNTEMVHSQEFGRSTIDMSVSLAIFFCVTSKQTPSKRVAGHTTETQRARFKKHEKIQIQGRGGGIKRSG